MNNQNPRKGEDNGRETIFKKQMAENFSQRSNT